MESSEELLKPENASVENCQSDLSCKNIDYARENYKAEIFESLSQLESIYKENPLKETRGGNDTGIVNSIKKKIKYSYEFLTGDHIPNDGGKDYDHDDITKRIYRRLRFRHGIIDEVEGLSSSHLVNAAICMSFPKGLQDTGESIDDKQQLSDKSDDHKLGDNKKGNKRFLILPPAIRAYNLAVTDVFVEKALAYLNRKARSYNRHGVMFIGVAFMSIIYAAYNAHAGINHVDANIINNNMQISQLWAYIIYQFVKCFTFYGLLVLVSVYAYRMAKAMFDQAERIKDRRHALRQGRLFVHLNGGMLNIEEMEKAFNWNFTQDNAFSHFNPDSSAPWGTVVKELLLTLREASKNSMESIKNSNK